jgi:anti-anti-sigma factor
MIDDTSVTVRLERYGRICVLAVSGELDLFTADGFSACAARAVEGRAERLILDLSGLRFTDCRGARALAAVTRAVGGECPVIVRSVRPAVRRVLDLMGLDLERRPGLAAGSVPWNWLEEGHRPGDADVVSHSPTARLVRLSQAARRQSQDVMAESRRVAEVVAATEDRLAVTLVRLAGRRPEREDRLRRLSEDAHEEAAYLRIRAKAAGRPGPGAGSPGPGP